MLLTYKYNREAFKKHNNNRREQPPENIYDEIINELYTCQHHQKVVSNSLERIKKLLGGTKK